MDKVSAYEAKTHFSALLERTRRGETVVITKHGRAVARLVPVDTKPDPGQVIDALRAARAGTRLGGLSVREMVEQGRRH